MKIGSIDCVCALLLSLQTTLAFSPNTKKTTSHHLTTSSMSTTTCPKTGNPLPLLPLPDPLLSLTPGTWAYDTMSRRLNKEILQRTYEENEEAFNSPPFAKALANFNQLRSELDDAANTKLRHLQFESTDGRSADVVAREEAEWKSIMQPYIDNGDTWLSAPWLVTEFYAYRRLIEAIGYYDKSNPDTFHYDPFTLAKRAGLKSSVNSAENMLERIVSLPNTKEGVALAAQIALWGNKMDLSIWPADTENSSLDVFANILHAADDNLLNDDTDQLIERCEVLRERGNGKIDIIVDNAGFELVTDLALADHLVASGVAQVVTFQLKGHPTFVSDALEKDLLETITHYSSLSPDKYPNAHAAGLRWQKYIDEGKWVCHEDNFWCQPNAMWEMPNPLRANLKGRCDLAFVKGDANYRRLLGDRYWDYSAPFQDVVGCYFPCPICSLRTLKAEVGCGMDRKQVERAKRLDNEWMVNGRFGVVQVGTGAE